KAGRKCAGVSAPNGGKPKAPVQSASNGLSAEAAESDVMRLYLVCTLSYVMAGLVPAISIRRAPRTPKPGHRGISAFTRVFDTLCPVTTRVRYALDSTTGFGLIAPVAARESAMAQGRRIVWSHVLTVVSAAILIGAEVFGAAFAGSWALATLADLGGFWARV